MWRRIFYGTLLAALISVLAVGGCVGLTLYEIQHLVSQVKALEEEYELTNTEFPPAGEPVDWITEDSVRDFLEIRRSTGDDLLAALHAIDQDLLEREMGLRLGKKSPPGFLDLMQTLRSHFKRLDAVGNQHVAALRERKMSSKVYGHHTRVLMATLSLADDAATTDPLHVLSGQWESYEPARRLFSDVFAGQNEDGSRLARPIKSLKSLRETLDAMDGMEASSARMGEILIGLSEAHLSQLSRSATGAAGSEMAPEAGIFRASGTAIDGARLLDLLIKQFDMSILAE